MIPAFESSSLGACSSLYAKSTMRSCSVNCCDCSCSIGRLRNWCLVWLDDGLWGCTKPWVCLWCSSVGQQSWDLPSCVKESHKKPIRLQNCRHFNEVWDHYPSEIWKGLLLPPSTVDLCGCCCSNKSKMECRRWHEYLSHSIIILKEVVLDELQLSLNKVSS